MPRITRLRHVLINSAVTQQTVAREANVPASKLSAYALGRAPIPPHYLIRLCKYFSLNPESLLGYTHTHFSSLSLTTRTVSPTHLHTLFRSIASRVSYASFYFMSQSVRPKTSSYGLMLKSYFYFVMKLT